MYVSHRPYTLSEGSFILIYLLIVCMKQSFRLWSLLLWYCVNAQKVLEFGAFLIWNFQIMDVKLILLFVITF